jgi:hypothetical protein
MPEGASLLALVAVVYLSFPKLLSGVAIGWGYFGF